jgi:hypothetical protein
LQPPPLQTTRLHAYGGNGNNFTNVFRLWRATHLRASAGAWAAAVAAFQLASALFFCFAARAQSHEQLHCTSTAGSTAHYGTWKV